MTTNERDEAARRLDEANRRARMFWTDRELWRMRATFAAFVAAGEAAIIAAIIIHAVTR